MRILVCGGRSFANQQCVSRTLDAWHAVTPITLIVTGGATGADALAENWARSAEVDSMTFRAKWMAEGSKAGPIRNARMLAASSPDMVLAFPGGKGTADMVRRARKAGIPAYPVEP